jgi:hypothetical protein
MSIAENFLQVKFMLRNPARGYPELMVGKSHQTLLFTTHAAKVRSLLPACLFRVLIEMSKIIACMFTT